MPREVVRHVEGNERAHLEDAGLAIAGEGELRLSRENGDAARAAPVIYIGTFSKVLFPALRVGYVVVPPRLWATVVRIRETLDIFSPTLTQAVIADFLREGHFARHLRRMRLYLGPRNALVERIRARLGGLLTVHCADAGLHVTGFLSGGVDDREVLRRAAARGITVTALSTCYAGRRARSGLVLGFGGSDERRLGAAVETLRDVIRELVPSDRARRP